MDSQKRRNNYLLLVVNLLGNLTIVKNFLNRILIVASFYQGDIEITNGGQYEVYSKFVESNWYQGELRIMNVQKENYGQYTCLVANKNGTITDTFAIKVDGTSIPDAPYDLQRVNSTHDSITISWQPGFNGGLPQKYTIIVRKVRASAKTTVEIPAHYGTVYTIRGILL